MTNPTPEEIAAARIKARLTTAQAAELVHCTRRCWQQWESGARTMGAADWELFLIKRAVATTEIKGAKNEHR